MTQTQMVLEELLKVRPFRLTAHQIRANIKENQGMDIPPVSVSRALNELAKTGAVLKTSKWITGKFDRRNYLWRATYKKLD